MDLNEKDILLKCKVRLPSILSIPNNKKSKLTTLRNRTFAKSLFSSIWIVFSSSILIPFAKEEAENTKMLARVFFSFFFSA